MLRKGARPGTWGRKAAQTIQSFQQFPCALSLLAAVLTWAHSDYRANREAHWLPIPSAGLVTSQQTPSGNPARCQLQMVPMTPFDTIKVSATNGSMTPFDTIIWPIFQKVTDDEPTTEINSWSEQGL